MKAFIQLVHEGYTHYRELSIATSNNPQSELYKNGWYTTIVSDIPYHYDFAEFCFMCGQDNQLYKRFVAEHEDFPPKTDAYLDELKQLCQTKVDFVNSEDYNADEDTDCDDRIAQCAMTTLLGDDIFTKLDDVIDNKTETYYTIAHLSPKTKAKIGSGKIKRHITGVVFDSLKRAEKFRDSKVPRGTIYILVDCEPYHFHEERGINYLNTALQMKELDNE